MASPIAAIAAVFLLGVAVYLAVKPEPAPDPPFIVTPVEHDLGAVPLGTHPVKFAIANPAGRSRRIIGCGQMCRGALCFSSNHIDPITVSAGDTFVYECELTVKQPGPFEMRIDLYLEDHGIRTITLTARGVATQPEGNQNGPADKKR